MPDVDNDELIYTKYYREIRAYKNLENIGEMVHPDSEFAEDVEVLRKFFKNKINLDLSEEAKIK